MQEPELAQRVGAIYSYGQPRVGDAAFRDAFCSAYGDRTWRLRNAGDIVPFLLPRWLGYRCVRMRFACITLYTQCSEAVHHTECKVPVIKCMCSPGTCQHMPLSAGSFPLSHCAASELSRSPVNV